MWPFCGFRGEGIDVAFGRKPARFGYDRGDVPNLAFFSSDHVSDTGFCATVPSQPEIVLCFAIVGGSVLVVEDERDIAFPLVRTLEREGYDVAWVGTGREVLDLVGREPSDVVILDLSLPDMDGLDVCRTLRDAGFEGAIMIVTARTGELDRVVGLDSGADDYLTKPFGLAELQARVRALLRRTRANEPPGKVDGSSLRLDVDARRVYAGDDEVRLTSKEFDVLCVLEAHRDKVVPRGRLMSEVWDENWYGSTKTLDVTIGRLRQKLEQAGLPDRVVAVRGVGFRLEHTLPAG
jgi:DNA-binding response OmpR family regulator